MWIAVTLRLMFPVLLMDDYERVLLVKPEIFVFRIPPLNDTKGYKAADWKLDAPDWTGRMRLVSVSDKLELRLEDRNSGALYAKAPIDKYPSVCLEPVTDSSRYFVIRLRNDNGQTAFVGIGFGDRGDSFDLNVSLQDFFKQAEKEAEFQKQGVAGAPSLDLSFKPGQTISINIGKKTTSRIRDDKGESGAVPFLPPPPSSSGAVPILPPPPGSVARPRP
ncbi:hypothetical protein L596_001563 [Steinernema carpocapsae]|uniref:NECAP PHear domain-containing protein n=1 Tax=Steinernema carpocapsae TaxID=34508 RepID=A0A4U8ULK9_STECR|nr:hypothetical protein L596_001563 [Steinernema carpocapsae]